ncbi:hypothetical protein FJZ26_01150, partial [Candidatus Parvarchaeota archaeon]|nr:hypothetical protein [Candidatus Parvarchaeota archaeon]
LGLFDLYAIPPAPGATVRFLGLGAFFLICVSLVIGPLAVLWPSAFGSIVESRRAVGISAFVFAALHSFIVLSFGLNWNFEVILSFFSFQLALPALVILLALALTSSDWVVRKLGFAKWQALHRLVYLAFVLLLGHFLIQATYGGKQLNLAEMALVMLGALTVLLQVAGFVAFRRKKEAGKAAQTSKN